MIAGPAAQPLSSMPVRRRKTRQAAIRRHQASDKGAATERDFDPYGLAYRFGAWYAVGWCHLREGLRSFRLDRIDEVALSDVHFVRPAGFDAFDYLSRNLATITHRFPIEILLRTNVAEARRALPFAFGSFEPVEGGVVLRSSADDLAYTCVIARRTGAPGHAFEGPRPDRSENGCARRDGQSIVLTKRQRLLPARHGSLHRCGPRAFRWASQAISRLRRESGRRKVLHGIG